MPDECTVQISLDKQTPKGQRETSTTGGSYGRNEDNTNLQGSRGLGTLSKMGVYEKMLKTNPVLKQAFDGLCATIQAANFDIELFERMSSRFQDTVRSLCWAFRDGFAPHEITTYAEHGKVWINRLDWRPPRTIHLWSVRKVWGPRQGRHYIECTQQYYRDHQVVYAHYGAPGERGRGWLWWPVYGEELFGTSAVRPIYNEHNEKIDIRKARSIGVQKTIFGTPYFSLKDGIDPADDATKNAIDQSMSEWGNQITHENGIGYLPPWADGIDVLYAQHDGIAKAIEAENHADVQILTAMGMAHLARGLFAAYSTGAQGKVDASEQRNIRRMFLDWVISQYQELIEVFIDLNFGCQRYYPELKAVHVPDVAPNVEVDNYSKLATAKGITPTDDDEVHFRKRAGLPPFDPDKARKADPPPVPETPGSFGDDDEPDTRDRPSEESDPVPGDTSEPEEHDDD
jgi:hypothetical protein